MVLFGKDIKVDFSNNDIDISLRKDFALVDEEDNLVQAIYLRLLTPKGSLPNHSEYGSKLYMIKGMNHDDNTLSLAILYTYESLSYEPRIEEIIDIVPSWVIEDGEEKLRLDITVKPIDTQKTLNVIIQYVV